MERKHQFNFQFDPSPPALTNEELCSLQEGACQRPVINHQFFKEPSLKRKKKKEKLLTQKE